MPALEELRKKLFKAKRTAPPPDTEDLLGGCTMPGCALQAPAASSSASSSSSTASTPSSSAASSSTAASTTASSAAASASTASSTTASSTTASSTTASSTTTTTVPSSCCCCVLQELRDGEVLTIDHSGAEAAFEVLRPKLAERERGVSADVWLFRVFAQAAVRAAADGGVWKAYGKFNLSAPSRNQSPVELRNYLARRHTRLLLPSPPPPPPTSTASSTASSSHHRPLRLNPSPAAAVGSHRADGRRARPRRPGRLRGAHLP